MTHAGVIVDRGAHLLLGDARADGADHGECGWTLLSDNLFAASQYRVSRLERLPYPRWWPWPTTDRRAAR